MCIVIIGRYFSTYNLLVFSQKGNKLLNFNRNVFSIYRFTHTKKYIPIINYTYVIIHYVKYFKSNYRLYLFIFYYQIFLTNISI